MKQGQIEIAVIGGGISGLGVAVAAARAGFETLLLERQRCCEATSKSSLRIMHGGFRYFQTLDLKRIIVSLADQHFLLNRYPLLIKPLPCLMPLSAWGLKSRWPVSFAGAAYSTFKRFVTGSPAEVGVRGRAVVEHEVPLLHGLVPHGALQWSDALLLDPAALKEALLTELRELGAGVAEETAVEEIRRSGSDWFLRAGGKEMTCRVVINCAGPWVGAIAREPECRVFDSQWCKGFNVVLNRSIEGKYAIGLHSDEGRLYFVVPRGNVSAIGTWYGAYTGGPDDMRISEQELAEFVAGFNRAWPGVDLKISEIAHIEAGVLPMKRLGRNGPVLHGSHRIAARGSYIEVLSTKYTTFRSQAEEVMKLAQPYLVSHQGRYK